MRPRPTLAPMIATSVPGAIAGKLHYMTVGSSQLNVEYTAYPVSGGPSVNYVSFQIYFGTEQVYTNKDYTYPYCAFGDNGKVCSLFVFDDYVDTWPGKHISIANGDYTLRVGVQDKNTPPDTWSLTVPFKIVMP